jgi:hypothetical protein
MPAILYLTNTQIQYSNLALKYYRHNAGQKKGPAAARPFIKILYP